MQVVKIVDDEMFKYGNRKRALICFTRIPQPKTTKTRLEDILTPQECAELQWAMLRDVAEACHECGADVYVAYSVNDKVQFEEEKCHKEVNNGLIRLREIFAYAEGFFLQKGGDLGEKMKNAISTVIDLKYDNCILIGSDIPEITGEYIDMAFEILEKTENDIVITPTSDHGYCLIGMKKVWGSIFDGKVYGSGEVCEDACDAAREEGKKVAVLPKMRDVDTCEDIVMLNRYEESGCEHTIAFLRLIEDNSDCILK